MTSKGFRVLKNKTYKHIKGQKFTESKYSGGKKWKVWGNCLCCQKFGEKKARKKAQRGNNQEKKKKKKTETQRIKEWTKIAKEGKNERRWTTRWKI
jgi:hypothetical protein